MALLHGVERSAQVRDGFTTRCRKERATRGEILHGVEKGAQVCDGFTTWCSKGRANRRFLKKSVYKVDKVKYVTYDTKYPGCRYALPRAMRLLPFQGGENIQH